MARKRLSDLLREEAQKPADSQADAVAVNTPEINSDSTTATAKTSTRTSKTTSSAKPPGDNALEQSSTQSTLDADVIELKNALEEAEQREAELKKQVAELKADLKNQTASEKRLQTSLEKAAQRNQDLETELAEAKQTALQLAEANSQLKQTLDIPPKQVPQKQEAKSLQPADQPTQPPPPAPLTQQEMIRRRQERSLAHPIFPTGKPPGQLSEQDLGWVD
ncbi:MAG: hypothetical protein HC866_01810 [Leptolyngbyaceae cyanobacterium RU_5_1]|nr:hypothetical protein [Leptolyngbyaceae cyanobacterium RU_5_1]